MLAIPQRLLVALELSGGFSSAEFPINCTPSLGHAKLNCTNRLASCAPGSPPHLLWYNYTRYSTSCSKVYVSTQGPWTL